MAPTSPRRASQRTKAVSGLHQCLEEKRYRQFCYLARSHTTTLDAPDREGLSPLLRCSLLEDEALAVNLVRLLLDAGANATLRDGRRMTALHHACKLGRYRLAKMMMRRVLDLSLSDADADGNTALHHAATSGNVELLGLLLDKCDKEGISTDRRNALGFTPLLLAASRGRLEAARKLVIDGGASLAARDDVHFRSAAEWLATYYYRNGDRTDNCDDGLQKRRPSEIARLLRAPRLESDCACVGPTAASQPPPGVLRVRPPAPDARAAADRGAAATASQDCRRRPVSAHPQSRNAAVAAAGVVRRVATAHGNRGGDSGKDDPRPRAADEGLGRAAGGPTSWKMLRDWTVVLYKQLSPSYRKPATPLVQKHEVRRPTVPPSRGGQKQRNVGDASADEARQPPKPKANGMASITSHFRLQPPTDNVPDIHLPKDAQAHRPL